MIVYLWVVIALNTIGIIVTPWAVGRERKPLTAGTAAVQAMLYVIALAFAITALLRGWAV